MLYLWIFVDNVEHRFGHVKFLIFYLARGLAATAVQIAMAPHSVIPNLGDSGAISGILGAYLVLFPRNKVNAVFFSDHVGSCDCGSGDVYLGARCPVKIGFIFHLQELP